MTLQAKGMLEGMLWKWQRSVGFIQKDAGRGKYERG